MFTLFGIVLACSCACEYQTVFSSRYIVHQPSGFRMESTSDQLDWQERNSVWESQSDHFVWQVPPTMPRYSQIKVTRKRLYCQIVLSYGMSYFFFLHFSSIVMMLGFGPYFKWCQQLKFKWYMPKYWPLLIYLQGKVYFYFIFYCSYWSAFICASKVTRFISCSAVWEEVFFFFSFR